MARAERRGGAPELDCGSVDIAGCIVASFPASGRNRPEDTRAVHAADERFKNVLPAPGRFRAGKKNGPR
jgi:hypothetical protein